MNLPVLYSYRRCPYAMRARIALRYCGIAIELREIVLKAKPLPMLQASPKGTVPVLVLADGKVFDESLDIMHWALTQHDPGNWLMADDPGLAQQAQALIAENDGAFKTALDRYKYANRFLEQPAVAYRAQGEQFLQRLETCLSRQRYLFREQCTLADMAIFPFIRQFAAVDASWFEQSPYPALRRWLASLATSELFVAVMQKQSPWVETQP